MRNEANRGGKGLIAWGRRVGLGSGAGGRFGGFGLEALEILEGGAVIALGGVHAALDAGEGLGVSSGGDTDGEVLVVFVDVTGALFPECGFDHAEAAEEPFGVDEDVDEHALFGSGGVEAVVIFGFEGFEVGGFFAADAGEQPDQGIAGRNSSRTMGRAGFFRGVPGLRARLSLRRSEKGRNRSEAPGPYFCSPSMYFIRLWTRRAATDGSPGLDSSNSPQTGIPSAP